MENIDTLDENDTLIPQPLKKLKSTRYEELNKEPEIIDENELILKLQDIRKQMDGEDIDENMIDPIFFNVIVDPVVISSGLVMDRSSFEDSKGTKLLKVCPVTRKELDDKAYPLIYLKKKLVGWRISIFDSCLYIAERINCDKKEFDEACQMAEETLKLLGDHVYIQKARRLGKVLLKKKIENPLQLAQIYLRIYKTLVNENDKQQFKDAECNKLFQTLQQKLDEKDLQGINQYLEACEFLQINSILFPKLNYIKLQIAKMNNNPVQIFDCQSAIYNDMLDSGCMPAQAFDFLVQEGIENKQQQMIPNNPIEIKIQSIQRSNSDDVFHLLQKTNSIKWNPRQIQIKMDWNDQGWGNAKGSVKISLMRKNIVIVENEPFGIAPHQQKSEQFVFTYDSDIVKKFLQGDHYHFSYRVGGGGGHSLTIKNLVILITSNPGSTTKPITIQGPIDGNDNESDDDNSD